MSNEEFKPKTGNDEERAKIRAELVESIRSGFSFYDTRYGVNIKN